GWNDLDGVCDAVGETAVRAEARVEHVPDAIGDRQRDEQRGDWVKATPESPRASMHRGSLWVRAWRSQARSTGDGWPARRRAPGARRATRSSEAAQADASTGPGTDRAPRMPSRSPVRTNDPPAWPTPRKARWSGRGPGAWMTRRGRSPASRT